MPFHINGDATPNSQKLDLCLSCRWSARARGSDGELDKVCKLGGFLRPVLMKVIECSEYQAINSQTLTEMKEKAWLLGTKKIVGLAGGINHEDVQVSWTKPEDRQKNNPPQTTVYHYHPK